MIAWIARRFLFSKHTDGFLSLVSFVSVLGVSLGVIALVVVTSVVNGFENEIIRAVSGINGEVILYSRGSPVSDRDRIEKKIKLVVPEVKAITPSLVSELMVSGPNGVAGSILEGVDLGTVSQVTEIPKRLKEGQLPELGQDEVVLGESLASRIGAKVGTTIRLVVPLASDGSGSEGAPKVSEVKVSGILKLGMYQYDSKYLYSSLPFVQKFLGMEGRVTTFKLKLPRDVDAKKVADTLSENFGYPFRAKDWGALNHNLLYAIQLEKAVLSLLLMVIVVVAAFNVVSSLMMLIHDKTREIAILKIMGFQNRQNFRLFSFVGGMIGVTGALIGVGSGVGLALTLQKTQLIQLPPDIYHISFLPVIFRWHEIAIIAVFGAVICYTASVYPAVQAAKRSPLEGLRHD